VVKDYKEKIQAAKKNRKKRFVNLLLVTVALILITPLVIAVFNNYEIEIKFEGNETSGRIELASGIGFKIGSNFFPMFDARTVRVKYLGYEEVVTEVPSNISNAHIIELRLLSKEVSFTPDSFIDSPVWMIDGNIVSYQSNASVRLIPGTYELLLAGKNIEEVKKTIQLFPNEATDEIQISTNVKDINVVLTSTPPGANVLLDGNLLGITPLNTTIKANYDKQQLLISKDGYVSNVVELSSASSEFYRNVLLEFETSTVSVRLNPTEGILVVNGEIVDSTNDLVNLSLYKNLENSVSYEKYGYYSFEEESLVADNLVDIQLQEIYTDIIVDSTPRASVYVNNTLLGQTPLQTQLQIGQYQIELVADGHAPFKKDFELLQGYPFVLEERLETIFRYLDRTSLASYKNTLGMNLIKVTGADFYIGAPRNERGQRANEIIRQIGFSRKFYISEAEITKSQYSKYSGGATASEEPVNNISWLDAVKFCNWLSKSEGYAPFYILSGKNVEQNLQSTGYRLPTEAEWEFIAKKINRRSQTTFVWGNEYEVFDEAGNIADATADGVAATIIGSYNDNTKELGNIKSYPAINSFYDLSGNISELVTDHYSLRSPSEEKYIDYVNQDPGIQRVIKGSNYLSSSWTELRASFREPINYDVGRPDVGFRIARYVH
jgi:formylglycine-generating enzyme required for sulfatase activity